MIITKKEASGKRWASDKAGNRLYINPPKSTKRPSFIDSVSWSKMSSAQKAGTAEGLKAAKLKKQVVPENQTAAAGKLSSRNPSSSRRSSTPTGKVAFLFAAISSFLTSSGDTMSHDLQTVIDPITDDDDFGDSHSEDESISEESSNDQNNVYGYATKRIPTAIGQQNMQNVYPPGCSNTSGQE